MKILHIVPFYNENEIGEAIKESKVPREELFITTKYWQSEWGYEEVLKAFQGSIEKLNIDYIDYSSSFFSFPAFVGLYDPVMGFYLMS